MSKGKITKQVHAVLRNNELIRKGYFKNSHYKLIAKLKVEVNTQEIISLLTNTAAHTICYHF